ncbi:13872_t:CDS:2 [Acaulospora morrowiae]|uniref:13872_t:CDS:1 n=1 Tax=Acaulospora morrowiae TaxID=94023 RepID=A0A9N9ATH1_9GLOM|nr:13872_t:CDS:2 [Acaulospora morrowiae]
MRGIRLGHSLNIRRNKRRQLKFDDQEESASFEEDDFDTGILKIDDVDDLCFKSGDPTDDYKIGETNVSQLFRNYQNESVRIAKDGGLFVESNVHEILSLSSIFLLIPNSHSKTMINIFGSRLVDKIHLKVKPVQGTTLNPDWELKFQEAIKKATKISRECAVDWFYTELARDRNLRENLGSVILNYLETLPIEKIRNEPNEITFIINYLDNIMRGTFHNPDKHIVQWPNINPKENSAIFIGEVSAPSQKDNVYKNCKDLIMLGVLMKDCMDSAIDKGADINIIGFQCVDNIIDFYITDLIQGIYFMIHVGQVSVPTSVKDMIYFVNEIEILLGIREILQKSYDTLHDKNCSPSLPLAKAKFKRDTFGTPQFNQLLSKTHDCYGICSHRYGHF